jgi:hypothetical protein
MPSGDRLKIASETGAIPYDIPGVGLSHESELCSFDTFLKKYALAAPALKQLAVIVRGADTSRLGSGPAIFRVVGFVVGTFANLCRRLREVEIRFGNV